MSSGGTSGAVKFPVHMEEIHQDWLSYSGGPTAISVDMISVMNTALGAGGNPYEGLTYTDPATDIAAVQTVFNDWETIADALNHITDWDTIIANALTETDTALDRAICKAVEVISGKDIRRAVKAFENRASYNRNRSVRRFAGQMADINAVQGSAFMLGLALIEAEHLSGVERFHAGLTAQILTQGVQQYLSVAVESSQTMSNMQQNNVVFQQALAQTLLEIKRIKTVAEAEFKGNEADLNAAFSEWDFRVFMYGGQLLGTMGGGTALPGKPSRVSSAIGGALGGASLGLSIAKGAGKGAAAGTAISPGLGTLIGAGLGALAGAFS